MRKRPYALNFSNYYVSERLAEVQAICDTTPDLTPDDLEQLANHILFGKDENHLSEVDKRVVSKPVPASVRHETSLEGLLENPAAAAVELESERTRVKKIRPSIMRPKYDVNGHLEDLGDSDIPGMVEVWETIDKFEGLLAMYDGTAKPSDAYLAAPLTPYKAYQIRKWLADLRLQQYYLKDLFRPTLHFQRITSPAKSFPNFCADTGLWLEPDEWAVRKRHPKTWDPKQPPFGQAKTRPDGKMWWRISENAIDYENPTHIAALLRNYVDLLKHCYERPDSETRALLWDLETYIEAADLTDMEQFILESVVAHRQSFWVLEVLEENGYNLTNSQYTRQKNIAIPRKIAQAATRLRIEADLQHHRIATKKCSKCGKDLPLHPLWYSRSIDKPSGFCSQCKECQKEARRGKR